MATVSGERIDDGVLRRFLGPSADAFVCRDALPGLVTVPALGSIGAAETHALCELALAHECESLERSLVAADQGLELDSDGDACGASFCGFYREHDIFAWADRLEAQAASTPASRAVRLARGEIEAAMAGADVEPLRPTGGGPMRCEAWLNVLRHGDFLRLHDHSGALLSGVFWLHVPTGAGAMNGDAAATVPWWSGAFLAARQAADGAGAEYCIVRAREGWCAFFPGCLHHAVLPLYAPGSPDAGGDEASEVDSRAIRISLSFNYTASSHPGVGGE